jgi:acetyltransferase-like isoleucine patch superfamily enzyme
MGSTTSTVLVPENTLDPRQAPANPIQPAAVRAQTRADSRIRLRALWALRQFGIRVLNYLTNYVVAYVPSFALRRLWYRHVLGIAVGPHVGVFMGTYVWFHGPRANRRNGVRIGRNTLINRRCTIDLRCGLTIGENVSISPEVMIVAASHDVNDPQFASIPHPPVTIEDHAFVGTRAMILPGVTIGRGAVVVAGAQVSKDVPPMTIVAGSPARPIGMREPGAIAYELTNPLPLFE